MIVSQEFTLNAPRERVWEFFLDVPRSSACMPGVADVSQVAEDTYRGRVQVKVGPLRAGFTVTVTLVEVHPCDRLVLHVQGDDRATGSLVQATVTARLVPKGEHETVVGYEMDLAIRGALGRFGGTVIQDLAGKMAEQFAACVERALSRPESSDGQSDG